MKRLFSSLFVVLIFLNVMGYYAILLGLNYQNTQEMIGRFDRGAYDVAKTESLKIPMKAPYRLYSEVFERVDGDFERDGKVYRLIKQRFYRDTFHIVYMKDAAATMLRHAIADYEETFSDAPNQDGKQPTTLLLFFKEYFSRHFSLQPNMPGWESPIRKETHCPVFIGNFTASIIHPPERTFSA